MTAQETFNKNLNQLIRDKGSCYVKFMCDKCPLVNICYIIPKLKFRRSPTMRLTADIYKKAIEIKAYLDKLDLIETL